MRFIVDSMLGSLARWLRMLGYEADYDSNANDNTLLEKTALDDAILLTRDEELYRRACSRDLVSFLVQGEKDEVRLGNLAKSFGLSLIFDMARARCPECGSTLREISRSEASTSVPDKSLKLYESFWKCSNMECSKTYWLGSHFNSIRQVLEKARSTMDKS